MFEPPLPPLQPQNQFFESTNLHSRSVGKSWTTPSYGLAPRKFMKTQNRTLTNSRASPKLRPRETEKISYPLSCCHRQAPLISSSIPFPSSPLQNGEVDCWPLELQLDARCRRPLGELERFPESDLLFPGSDPLLPGRGCIYGGRFFSDGDSWGLQPGGEEWDCPGNCSSAARCRCKVRLGYI